MIISFQHKGLKLIYKTGSTRGISADPAKGLRRVLGVLDQAQSWQDADLPGYRLHALKGDKAEFRPITISGNWRVIFRFDGLDVKLVDYVDCHLR
ncbi:type II toxin-antitoxin system RelE/ParE family toxin [Pseudomonas sp. NyZ704]|nr:type II toxin-antitoxin system RelE/ParE family toxin [Pseudomonas sp. NyZ704]